MQRRDILGGLAALGLTGCTGVGPQGGEGGGVIFVPGYNLGDARPENEPADSTRRRAQGGQHTLITRIAPDGHVTQAAFPVVGHDIAISPNGSVGFFGQMGPLKSGAMAHHVAFDPVTLELIGQGRSPDAGWRGGGHGVFLADGTLITSERAPLARYTGRPADHHGRLVRRDPVTLAVQDAVSCHGIDPHEMRLSGDGRTLAVANYGSVLPRGERQLGQPRRVVAPSVTLVDPASGALVARYDAPAGVDELRHLAVSDQTIFAIRARLGGAGADAPWQAALGEGPKDITATPGETYLPSAPLLFDRADGRHRTLAADLPEGQLRHGLSVEYEPVAQEFIASFPTSHRLVVFSAQDGSVTQTIDTRDIGLKHPCGIALLPGGRHYAVAGYWRDLHVFERGSHRHLRRIAHRPVLYGHSHMTAA